MEQYRILTVRMPDSWRITIFVNFFAKFQPPVLMNWLQTFDLINGENSGTALFHTFTFVFPEGCLIDRQGLGRQIEAIVGIILQSIQ